MTTRTIEVMKTRKLKNGETKKYKSKNTYIVKGPIEVDDEGNVSVRRTKFDAATEADILSKWREGVTKARLCKNYNCSITIINRICTDK